MTNFLLDTNTCVEVLRNRNAGVVARFRSCIASELRLCSIVVAELTYGAYKSQRPAHNLSLVATFSSPLISLPFDNDSADLYGQIRVDLEARGIPIGPNDTMIAAIALQHDLTVVTHNTTEFARVSNLKLEDWHI
ncbi:MAG TPA: type II toxin-antitoxin system VapC family toxin [Planctomycetaceae bacterium]|nr:type II toxin-antitoxin system VapC family toxin [Planctomycetaceae bacterium]HQZ65657.1 type II toxin-antitoxin system VapC family toxin [Planctomycetaceae bacterium]